MSPGHRGHAGHRRGEAGHPLGPSLNYVDFLGHWLNLTFLGLGLLGAGAWLEGKIRDRDRFLVTSVLASICVAGLTFTGAVHDLGLGSPADHLAWILPGAVALGGGTGWLLWKARMRWFPPVRGVRINPSGQVGARAQVVSATVSGDPGSGRAQWRTSEGVLVVVRCHTAGNEIGFGDQVQLEDYDDDTRSYRVVAR